MSVALKALLTKPKGAYDSILVQATLSGNYTTAGDTADLTKIANLAGLADVPQPSLLPILVNVITQAMDGYYAEWVTGTTLANGKLRFWQPGGSEYANGAYGAPFTNANPAVMFLEILLQNSDR